MLSGGTVVNTTKHQCRCRMGHQYISLLWSCPKFSSGKQSNSGRLLPFLSAQLVLAKQIQATITKAHQCTNC